MKEKSSIDWIFPVLRKPFCGSYLWKIASNFTITAVGLFSKILIGWLNNSKCHNQHSFSELLDRRNNVPLITVSNHDSCFDDPGIWGCLKWRHVLSGSKMRWSLAAHDICFTNKLHSYFFMLGKCIPVIRGNGVYQDAINFCLEKLQQGEWVHVFPEGRVNTTKEFIRLKWGVGRMIYESPITPIVVPIWHIGMEEILPNEPPYILKTGKRVTFNFGEPINFSNLLKELRAARANAEQARKAITDKIQVELMKLKLQTESLHRVYHSKS
ncbi:tafazzin homolog [Cimex lectularius]|uniref:Tafazzin family protein n=1 Tax=Cimex lectularius TaxID=79782 RepID=A0A8I6RI09_CIMLE|nr:tafazzin homolog [Cimex lectularius]